MVQVVPPSVDVPNFDPAPTRVLPLQARLEK
jgi:hypothetical protein